MNGGFTVTFGQNSIAVTLYSSSLFVFVFLMLKVMPHFHCLYVSNKKSIRTLYYILYISGGFRGAHPARAPPPLLKPKKKKKKKKNYT